MKKLLILFLLFLFTLCSCKKEDKEVHSVYIDAKSYVVIDKTTNRVLEGKNINDRMLPASTTKVLTCLTVLNNFDINQYITITREMINIEGSRLYLNEGEVISVLDLLYGLMLNSGNDASLALAIGLTGNVNNFTYLMNEECKKIGMLNSTFENPNGLDGYTKNLTTTYDMSLLLSRALENETFRKIASTKEYKAKLPTGRTLYFNNKHRLIHTNDLVTSGKTGYTKKAGRTLLTSYKKDNFEIVICTFDCGNDWEVHNALANKTFNTFNQERIIKYVDLINYVGLNIDKNKLLFPLEITESKDQITSKINLVNNVVYINYYKDNKLIGTSRVN